MNWNNILTINTTVLIKNFFATRFGMCLFLYQAIYSKFITITYCKLPDERISTFRNTSQIKFSIKTVVLIVNVIQILEDGVYSML